MFKVFLIVIFLGLSLLDISYVDSFGKRRCRQQKITTPERKFYNPLTDSQNDCIDPYCNCRSVGFGIVQQIPYSPVTSSCDPINVQFSSACIRCGLCLAVAEQINQTLIETHDTMKPDQWLNDDEASSILKAICDHAFRHYSLREISGKRYICDRIPGATLVASSADGFWEINLKTKCKSFLNAMGPLNLYKHWQRWSGFDRQSQDLTTILCRGEDGIFRDCKSIPNLSRPESKEDGSFFSNMRVMVEIKCQ